MMMVCLFCEVEEGGGVVCCGVGLSVGCLVCVCGVGECCGEGVGECEVDGGGVVVGVGVVWGVGDVACRQHRIDVHVLQGAVPLVVARVVARDAPVVEAVSESCREIVLHTNEDVFGLIHYFINQ